MMADAATKMVYTFFSLRQWVIPKTSAMAKIDSDIQLPGYPLTDL
jgi:hypothetical protein